MGNTPETAEIVADKSKDRLSPKEYYRGLAPIDAMRIRSIVGFIDALNAISPERFAVMAYGSTTRVRDRHDANDIDLKILNNAKDPEARRRVVKWVTSRVKDLLSGSDETFLESPQTFRWDGETIKQDTNAYDFELNQNHDCGAPHAHPNEDPSFIVFPAQTLREKTLPIHISIAGPDRLSTDDTIAGEREWGRASVILTS